MSTPLTKMEIIASCNVNALIEILRSELMANVAEIPQDLKENKAWLLWKTTEINPTTGKFNKIPFYPLSCQRRQGLQGGAGDLANLGTWDEVITAFNTDESFAGVGFAVLPGWNIVALDVDHCISNNKVRDDVAQIVDETYSEVSPSGTGIRAFWRGEAKNGQNKVSGFELYHSSQFVTVTGHWNTDGPIATLTDTKRAQLEALSLATDKPSKPSPSERLKETAKRDPRLQAVINEGLYE